MLIGIIAAGGAVVYLARAAENTLAGELAAGSLAIEKDRLDDAVAAFRRAAKAHGPALNLGRKLHFTSGGMSAEETGQVFVAALLLKAYAEMFDLKSAQAPLEEAQKHLDALGSLAPADLSKDVASARACEQIRAAFAAGKVREGLKALLAADHAARKGDTDFSIQEIRLLIAGGKKLKSDAILNQARELLWLMSSNDEKNPRLNQLWGILSRP